MLSKTSSSGALEAFDRMEGKIEKMEAEAEVCGRILGSVFEGSFIAFSAAYSLPLLIYL